MKCFYLFGGFFCIFFLFFCSCVDSHRKIPITYDHSNYFREKEEGMILQVKLSLTVKSKTSVIVGWVLVVCFFF